MPRLKGRLTRKQRIEIAKDVIALCKSRQRKITISTGTYFSESNIIPFSRPSAEDRLLEEGGQLTSKRLPPCAVCARGALFVASVDRHDRCDLGRMSKNYEGISGAVQSRSLADWGYDQTALIERDFENEPRHLPARPKARLVAIMENIVANNGEYKSSRS